MPLFEEIRRPSPPWLVIAFASVALIISCFPALQSLFQLDFSAVRSGQIWRLFSAHLTHWSWSHFFWDTLVFLVAGVIAERNDRRELIAVILLASIVISAAMMALYPKLGSYRGLSGIDTALVALVIVQFGRSALGAMKLLAAVVFLAMIVKTGVELLWGQTLFVDNSASGFTPVPMAHLIGAAVGLGVGLTRPIMGAFGSRIKDPCFSQLGA